MPSAMVKENFCVFLSVREPTVTVHLTGFFHTPKLLQPQLRNPENCKQARQCLEFHTSLKRLILPFIATGFSFLFFKKCNLWHELTMFVFCFFFWVFFLSSPDCNERSKGSSMWLCDDTNTSWLIHNRSLQTGFFFCVNVWSKSGRPVSLTTVFADCGRLASVFLSF